MLLSSGDGISKCESCGPDNGQPAATTQTRRVQTDLETLGSTKSGSIRKEDAMQWLSNLNRPNPTELRRSVLPKPAGFEGSAYATDVSSIRVTGDARFVETIAGLLEPLVAMENDETRVELNLKRTKDRDTEQYTGNYALYLSVAQRGGQ